MDIWSYYEYYCRDARLAQLKQHMTLALWVLGSNSMLVGEITKKNLKERILP